jgi:hypothetical protein
MAPSATASKSFDVASGEKLAPVYQMTEPWLVRWSAQKQNTTGMNCLQGLKKALVPPIFRCLFLVHFIPEINW